MHGITETIKLDRFHGATLVPICIGEFQQQFHFVDPELHLSIEGEWMLTNSAGDTVDRNLENSQRESFRPSSAARSFDYRA